jgi:WhiB family redox-sensing transcriptional regulator
LNSEAKDKMKSYLHDMANQELEWHQEALCAQTDPEIFFPEGNTTTKQAKAICKTCPVSLQCLEYALKRTEVYGIWGGTTATERQRMRAPRRIGRPSNV